MTKSIKWFKIVVGGAIVHKNIYSLVLTLALTIFVGACTSKKVELEQPTQPDPIQTTSIVEPFPGTEEVVTEDKPKAWEVRQARLKEEKDRIELLKEEELERLKSDPREAEILARAAEIEREKAAKKAMSKTKDMDSYSIRKARAEFEKAERNTREAEERKVKAYSRADIRGCKPDTVEVSPAGTHYSNFNAVVVIRIVNSGNHAIESIETPYRRYGVVVRSLCAEGSLQLSFVLGWHESDSVTIPLTVIAKLSNGRIATETQQFNLNRGNVQYNRVDHRVWEIRLDNR